MKLYTKLIILLLLSSSCSAQKNNTLTINYEAYTRGNSVKIDVDSKQLIYSNFEGEKVYTITDEQWKAIQKSIDNIDLNSIKDLKAPSTKSHTDAALIASIKIKNDDKTYESATFDHGNPPEKLKKLIDILFEIAKIN